MLMLRDFVGLRCMTRAMQYAAEEFLHFLDAAVVSVQVPGFCSTQCFVSVLTRCPPSFSRFRSLE
jgi:hypothetical protein